MRNGVGVLVAWAVGVALLASSTVKCRILLRAVRRRHVPRQAAPGGSTALSFSLLVPARAEAEVLERTLLVLADARHPKVEILALVSARDRETWAAAARAAAARPDRVRVIAEPPGTRGKPEALNAALAECRYEIVGVFDADGAVHPDLLSEVDSLFVANQLDALQAANQPLAPRPRWYQLHNMVEFFGLFLSSHQPVPTAARVVRLSGNSVFFRAATLRSLGGWRPGSLVEDCEISLRLAAAGARVQVWRSTGLVTMEEVPARLTGFVRQRTRWNQGFVQVLRRGSWRRLAISGHRRQALWFLLESPARVAGGVAVLVAAALVGPLWTAAAAAAVPVLLFGTVNTILLARLAGRMRAEFGLPARRTDTAVLLAGSIPFQLLLGLCATRAVVRSVRGRDNWEKTEHTGDALDLGAARPGSQPVTR